MIRATSVDVTSADRTHADHAVIAAVLGQTAQTRAAEDVQTRQTHVWIEIELHADGTCQRAAADVTVKVSFRPESHFFVT